MRFELWVRGDGIGRALLSRGCVLTSGLWGVFGDAQAQPSAIDCSAFPINYSLIMESGRCWLHGSSSSSHVAAAWLGGDDQPVLLTFTAAWMGFGLWDT